jgi:hypothetical protein
MECSTCMYSTICVRPPRLGIGAPVQIAAAPRHYRLSSGLALSAQSDNSDADANERHSDCCRGGKRDGALGRSQPQHL